MTDILCVPWYKQQLVCKHVYQCRLCSHIEKYRAINNIPQYAHLCTNHFNELNTTEKEKNNYIGILQDTEIDTRSE